MDSSDRTKQLLQSISSHLSYRSCCRQVQYVVTISDNYEIQMYPDIQVFPNRYNHRKSDKLSVLEHVLREHVPSPYLPLDTDNGCKGYVVLSKHFVPGVYTYKLSIDKKRRKWIRTK